MKEHLAYGDKKYNGICKLGRLGKSRRIDIMYTKPNEYPFAILYFTGSDSFNKEMRQKCLKKGLSLNEYYSKLMKLRFLCRTHSILKKTYLNIWVSHM